MVDGWKLIRRLWNHFPWDRHAVRLSAPIRRWVLCENAHGARHATRFEFAHPLTFGTVSFVHCLLRGTGLVIHQVPLTELTF